MAQGIIAVSDNLDKVVFSAAAAAAIVGGRLASSLAITTRETIANAAAQRGAFGHPGICAGGLKDLLHQGLISPRAHLADAAGRPARLLALNAEAAARANLTAGVTD